MEDQKKDFYQQDRKLSRRAFVGGAAAAAAAAFTIVPRHVLGGPGYTPPNEKLNIAGIGVGGQGARDIALVSSENIVALCDVDDKYAAEVYDQYPKAKKYRDFRKMLEKQKDIDAVVIATPDHTHAVITMMAIKMGKHVYCEKPLTHTVYEARKIAEAARKAKVATQMGNQGHSGEGIRLICEWIWDGAIGLVREVRAWENRPRLRRRMIHRPADTPPVPATLDWDLWLGPAQERPYHPCYLPGKWRDWWDFGTGALGDMGCHILDPVFWALKLRYPVSVEASFASGRRKNENGRIELVVNKETYPEGSIVRYKFPARENMPSVKLTWYDGGLKPARPEELEPSRGMGSGGGNVLFIGDKGKIMCGCGGESPRLIPETKMQQYKRPPRTLPRSIGHYKEWIKACKGGKPPGSNFDHAGPLTEMVLLGNIAIRTGKKLNWDGLNMEVTNVPEANEFVHRQYCQGWTL